MISSYVAHQIEELCFLNGIRNQENIELYIEPNHLYFNAKRKVNKIRLYGLFLCLRRVVVLCGLMFLMDFTPAPSLRAKFNNKVTARVVRVR
jgi:hypothetical protein